MYKRRYLIRSGPRDTVRPTSTTQKLERGHAASLQRLSTAPFPITAKLRTSNTSLTLSFFRFSLSFPDGFPLPYPNIQAVLVATSRLPRFQHQTAFRREKHGRKVAIICSSLTLLCCGRTQDFVRPPPISLSFPHDPRPGGLGSGPAGFSIVIDDAQLRRQERGANTINGARSRRS